MILVMAGPAMADNGLVTQVPSAISINKPIRQWVGPWSARELNFVFVGKVTAANGTPQKGREVTLFNWARFSGGPQSHPLQTILTGAYPGHSSGYWQLTVGWQAGIASEHFFAYVKDTFVNPMTNIGAGTDYFPAESRLMPFTG
ncbi:MAG: hypothetical protein ACXVHK_29105 [Solirubrobacteraceae bacterium]